MSGGPDPSQLVSGPDWTSIPAPKNDGGADHLTSRKLPSIPLTSTDDSQVDLASLRGRAIVYVYPMTGRPDAAPPDGWDGIPGARGCTPQSCAFRDHFSDLKALGIDQLFGLSVQASSYQKEVVGRLHLPFPLLSDIEFKLAQALGLPTFEAGGMVLLKRMTWVIENGEIRKVFYPVFPPDRNANDVIDWLKAQT